MSSGESDQMPYSVASDLSVHCLSVSLLGVCGLKWVTVNALKLRTFYPIFFGFNSTFYAVTLYFLKYLVDWQTV